MAVFLLSLIFMALMMAAMAVGVIFSNRELQGSCGGPDACACELAGRPKACEQLHEIAEKLHREGKRF
ncbi:MAG: hypothetical protein AAGJ35_02525 [Myxococcota bacterium]